MIKNSSLSSRLQAICVDQGGLVAAETRAERAMIDGRVASARWVKASRRTVHSLSHLSHSARPPQLNSRNPGIAIARPEVDDVGPGLLPLGLAEHLFEILRAADEQALVHKQAFADSQRKREVNARKENGSQGSYNKVASIESKRRGPWDNWKVTCVTS